MSKFGLSLAQDRLNELKYGKQAWALIKELRQECEDRAGCESSLLDWNEKLAAQAEAWKRAAELLAHNVEYAKYAPEVADEIDEALEAAHALEEIE